MAVPFYRLVCPRSRSPVMPPRGKRQPYETANDVERGGTGATSPETAPHAEWDELVERPEPAGVEDNGNATDTWDDDDEEEADALDREGEGEVEPALDEPDEDDLDAAELIDDAGATDEPA